MSWRRIRTLVVREVRATLRDRFTLGLVVMVPIFSLLLFGYVLSTEPQHLGLGVHDASDTPASRRLLADVAATGLFDVRPYVTRDAMERALVSGELSAAIVVPPSFDRRLGAGREAEVQVLYDGAEPVVAGNAEAALQALLRTGARALGGPGRGQGAGATVETKALFNPRLDGRPFMVAGTYGFVLSFLTTLITAVSIVNERRSGTFEQLQVTPATSVEILLGKILPLGGVFALDVVLMVLVGGFVFGAWPRGSVVFFVVVSTFYVLVSLSLGLIFSATSATPAEAVQKTVLFSIPLVQMSGFLFPVRSMPLLFQVIAKLFPATHYIAVSRAIYIRAEGPVALLPELAILAGFAAVLVVLAVRSIEARA